MHRYVARELEALSHDLSEMATAAEAAVGRAVQSLLERDLELAEDVLRGDVMIDRLEVAIEERCLRVLALYQPEAGDLRLIAMALKLNTDLERIGDQAVNIAERSIELLKEPGLETPQPLAELARMALAMFRASIDAFSARDTGMARAICLRDDAVDDMDDRIVRDLVDRMLVDRRWISRAVQLILVSRHLERVADHATNIAEDVIYLVEGRTIKHHLAASGAAPPEPAS